MATEKDIVWYLTDGYWEERGGARHAFNVQPGGTLTVNITGLTLAGQQLARWALDAWTNISGIRFQEVTHNSPHIMFYDHMEGAGSNYRYYLNDGSTADAWVNVSTDWLAYNGTGIDSYSFTTYVHEIGHALGLGHPGDYNAGDGPVPVTFRDATFPATDVWALTVMSYFDQHENPNFHFLDVAMPTSPMLLDIFAIHELYGHPAGVNAGDTVYGGSGGNTGTYMDEVFSAWEDSYSWSRPNISLTIYDTGGHDRLDLSAATELQLIDLGYAGVGFSMSAIYGRAGNLVLLATSTDEQGNLVIDDPNMLIEDAIGGTGDDILLGNVTTNYLYGNRGNDILAGGKETDILHGGPGYDTFIFLPQDGQGIDFILDFDGREDYIHLGEFDTIRSLADLDYYRSSASGNINTVLDLTEHGGGYVVLMDYSEPLRGSDFIFGNTLVSDFLDVIAA